MQFSCYTLALGFQVGLPAHAPGESFVDASAFGLRLELLGGNLCFGLHGPWTMTRFAAADCNVGAERGALLAWAGAAGLRHRSVAFILNLHGSPGKKPRCGQRQ